MKEQKKLVVGNWKMKPATFKEAQSIFKAVSKGVGAQRGVDVVLCPPIPFLTELKRSYKGKKIQWGAQNCFWENAASKTGEYSPTMVQTVGAKYVILGHSERRALGETNEQVNKKLKAALEAKLQVILCFGEHERDRGGRYVTFLTEQLHSALAGVSKQQLDQLIIAYEPIWAIGKSAAESTVRPDQVHEMVIFVRKFLTEQYGRAVAESVPVLYGGSVEPANCEPLLFEGQADGVLIGHSSIVPNEFVDIVNIANKKR